MNALLFNERHHPVKRRRLVVASHCSGRPVNLANTEHVPVCGLSPQRSGIHAGVASSH
jgi:hypothetical protein